MKIGVSGDWHIDNMGGTYLIDGTPNREIDIEKQIKYMAKTCVEEGVDLFVINGDLFSRSTTTGYYIAFAITLIEYFTNNGIEVIILPGNHDITEKGRGLFPALEKLKNDYVKIIEEACVVNYKEVKIFYAPHERKEKFKEYSSYTKYLLKRKSNIDVDVMIGHYQPKGAIAGSEDGMFAGSTRFVDTKKFKSCTQLVNHVHKPQIIEHDHDVYLIGSPVRFNIGERKEVKQFVIWDSENDSTTSYNLKCQKISKIRINLVDKNSYELDYKRIKKYKGHMVGIYVDALKENRAKISQAEIKSAFEKAGAHIVQFKITTAISDKKEKIKINDMSPDSVFKRIANREVEDEKLKKNVIKIGLQVLDEMGEENEF